MRKTGIPGRGDASTLSAHAPQRLGYAFKHGVLFFGNFVPDDIGVCLYRGGPGKFITGVVFNNLLQKAYVTVVGAA
jgi:hypothetical protein